MNLNQTFGSPVGQPESAPPLSWVMGQRVSHFELVVLMHESRTNLIWQVKDRRFGTLGVLKAAHRNPEALLRMDTERTLLSLLQGPHIPQLLDQGEHDGLPYFVMEHVPGVTLREKIHSQSMALGRIVETACQMATALHRLHRQGVLHLDLAPSHVMFRPTGEVVLLSWGLARHERQPDLHENTFSLDHSAYLSPEQIQWQRQDVRSDLFSWAVMVYECLTDQLPLGEPRSPAELRRRQYQQPTPPRSLRHDCPDWLQDIVLRNLEPAPQRHRSAAQLLVALRYPAPPEQLGERAYRVQAPPSLAPWWHGVQQAVLPWLTQTMERPPDFTRPTLALQTQLQSCPLVMVLVDIDHESQSQRTLRHCTEQLLCAVPRAHFVCVALLRPQDGTRHPVQSAAPSGALSVPNADIRTPPPLGAKARLAQWAHPLLHHSQAQCLGGTSFHVMDWPSTDELAGWVQAHLIDHLFVGADLACGWDDADLAGRLGCVVTVVPSTL